MIALQQMVICSSLKIKLHCMSVASFVLQSNCFLPNSHGGLYDSSPVSDWLGVSNPIEAADGG